MRQVRYIELSADNAKSNYLRKIRNVDCSGNQLFFNPSITSAAAGLGVNVLYLDPTTGEVKRSTS